MKKHLLIIFAALMAISFIQGCGGDDGDSYGYIEITVSKAAVSASDINNRHDVSYYLIDVYNIKDTQNPVVSTTRIDSPDTSATIYSLPVSQMLFVCKGYDAGGTLIYQGSAEKHIKVGNNGSLDIPVSLAGWYWQDPLPQGNSIRGAWGITGEANGTDLFAIGDTGTILHYDGSKWTIMDSGTYNHLHGIWGSSFTDIFAAGGKGTILRYDGTSWSKMNSGTDQRLFSVWGSSASDVFVVGTNGTILHYDGTGWRDMASPEGVNLNAVWGTSGTDVFAVGEYGIILHYDGEQWTTKDPGTEDFFYGVWGSSENDIYAVGYYRGPDIPVILHYDGVSWSIVDHGITEDIEFLHIWGTSEDNIYLVGLHDDDIAGERGVIYHYDGKSWSDMDVRCTSLIYSISGSSDSNIFSAGGYGTIFHYPTP